MIVMMMSRYQRERERAREIFFRERHRVNGRWKMSRAEKVSRASPLFGRLDRDLNKSVTLPFSAPREPHPSSGPEPKEASRRPLHIDHEDP